MLRKAAVAWLSERLPSSWQIDDATQAFDGGQIDDLLTMQAPDGTHATLAVAIKQTVTPRDAEAMLPGRAQSLRAGSPYAAVLVVAPWLSQRTREVLAANNINYLDLTGNALLRLENPGLPPDRRGHT
jgi:hypothetical protein